MFSVVNVYHDHLKFCAVCIDGRRRVCRSYCNVVSNECNEPRLSLPPLISLLSSRSLYLLSSLIILHFSPVSSPPNPLHLCPPLYYAIRPLPLLLLTPRSHSSLIPVRPIIFYPLHIIDSHLSSPLRPLLLTPFYSLHLTLLSSPPHSLSVLSHKSLSTPNLISLLSSPLSSSIIHTFSQPSALSHPHSNTPLIFPLT